MILIESGHDDVNKLTSFLEDEFPMEQRASSSTYLTKRKMIFLSWRDIELLDVDYQSANDNDLSSITPPTANTNSSDDQADAIQEIIVDHHNYCNNLSSLPIRCLRPLSTSLEIQPGVTITLKHALSTFCKPHGKGQPIVQPQVKLILDSVHVKDNPHLIRIWCYNFSHTDIKALLCNLDRTFEIHYRNADLLQQVLLPHCAKGWHPDPILL
jgi:hypothetical protein